MALSNESGSVSADKDDLASCDEVKVYQDEGDGEQRSSENLSEEKLGLVNETEESPTNTKSDKDDLTVKTESVERNGFQFPYFPSFYPNGQFGHPAFERFSPVNTFGLNLPGLMFCPSQEGAGRLPLSATPPLPPMYQDFTQWRPNSFFPMPPGTLRDSLIPPLGFTMNRFGAPYMHPPPGFTPFAPYFTPKSESVTNMFLPDYYRPNPPKTEEKPKKPHIKKPLNAFMLFMKEQRGNVVSECTLKESAAINQILGRKWHELQQEDQAKYFEMARQERLKHMEMYPGWSARDNYGLRKKRKKKREKNVGENGELARKCRARYGLDQINMWCKPCRRKKKCIRFTGSDDNASPSTECTEGTETDQPAEHTAGPRLNEICTSTTEHSPEKISEKNDCNTVPQAET